MKRIRVGKALACFEALALTLALAGLSFSPAPATAQSDDNAVGVELRPGILFHPTLDVVYVMTPDGIAALDIATGNKQWTSKAAARPLTLVGNLLISLAESATAWNQLELVALDIQKRGEPVLRGVTELPAGVLITASKTVEGTFDIVARPSADSVDIYWSFQPVRRERFKEDLDDAEVGKPRRSPDKPSATIGRLQMSLKTGTLTKQGDARSGPPWPRRQRTLLLNKDRERREARYESMDGRHVLASQRVADDRVWEKYLWTVYERRSGRRLGEFRAHNSFNLFVVRDSLVIFETTPFERLGSPKEPAKLRALSLDNGREAWGVEVREIVYRGPLPP